MPSSGPTSPLRTLALVLTLAAALSAPPGAGAQSAPAGAEPSGWNSPRALELVGRARALRQRRTADSGLRAYAAEARGHVYFLIDRPGEEERTLVKADQIALEIYWHAPDLTRQRIVGQRDRKVLPTGIQYHLDHLTVVQDEFADRIRLGDGDEVSDVVHPVAPGAEAVYDYRLADSLTLTFGGTRPDVRVYELLVRPEDVERPGFVGSVFLDRASAAIVRMSFTFTPASYVDPYLDYIRISLDNSLWEGRWWLPYRQEAEIRRELPQLDFLAGSIIRGRFEIGGYALDPDLPPELFLGPRVTAAPEAQREAFAFEDPLLPEDDAESLAPTPTLEEVRAAAREAVGARALSGLRRFRLHVEGASDVFRYDRAEGVFLGLGFGWRPSSGARVTAMGGWSFGREDVSLEVGVAPADPSGGLAARGYYNDLRDMGPVSGPGGVVNTLSALMGGEDYLDPWFAHGLEVAWRPPGSPPGDRARVRLERQASARYVVDGGWTGNADDFRPVRAAERGDALEMAGVRTFDLAHGLTLRADADLGFFRPATGRGPPVERVDGATRVWQGGAARLAWSRTSQARPLALGASLLGAWVSADAPRQRLLLLGGRETLLGHPYRSLVGDVAWLARASAERTVVRPWVTARVFAAAGQAELTRHPLDAATWGADPSAGVKGSVGAGVGLAWDILQLDVGRGLGEGGGWDAAVSVSRRFRGWL